MREVKTDVLKTGQLVLDGADLASTSPNYLLNPVAAVDTSNWLTYKNTAQTSPVTGIGGTPTVVTWTRSTTAPIYGLGSFIFTKSASNGQGEGVSTNFSISPADSAVSAPLEISFRMTVNSGTYASGDVIVYVYDVTNGALVSGFSQALMSADNTFRATFKANPTSQNYRLILHCATTSALAYSLKMDGFRIGLPLVANVQGFQKAPDTNFRIDGSMATPYGSTGSNVMCFNTANIRYNFGDGAIYVADAVNGHYVRILRAGVWTFNAFAYSAVNSNGTMVISKNSNQLATNPTSLPLDQVLGYGASDNSNTNRGQVSVSWTGPLEVNDIIRVHWGGSDYDRAHWVFSYSQTGTIQSITASSSQKIELPSSELRFENASSRGSTDTSIVRFDTLASIQGDAFTVSSDSVFGTVITLRKDGFLEVNTTVFSGGNVFLTRNQNVRTTSPLTTEILNTARAGTDRGSCGWSGKVKVGDQIRVSCDTTPTSNNIGTFLTLLFMDSQIPLAINTVQPQWSESDSYIRLHTANGYGSTGNQIRRFSTVVDNVGSAITYTDSATQGAFFTINEAGVYWISSSDCRSGNTPMAGISLNASSLTTDVLSLAASERLAASTDAGSGTNATANAAWAGFLPKDSIIRAHTGGSNDSTTPRCHFSIAKVGKPNLTAVDVTAFITMQGLTAEAIEVSGSSSFGSTDTGVARFPTVAKNTNLGILRYEDSATLGTVFTALRDCTAFITGYGFPSASRASIYVTKNSTVRTATTPAAADTLQSQTCESTGNGNVSTSVSLVAGETLRIQRDSTNITSIPKCQVVALASSPNVVSTSGQVYSDTLNFTFKATAITSTDPIGTFNTYTYAVNSNTATLAGTAPTQTTASMATDGFQLFARAYNAASTAAQPARVQIFIGKGLLDISKIAYKGTGKTTAGSLQYAALSSTVERGLSLQDYDAKTGILTLDAGLGQTISAGTGRDFLFSDNTSASSAFITFSASSNPALLSVPYLQQKIAVMRDEKASGTNGGTSVTSYTARILNTLDDPSSLIINASSFTGTGGTNTQFQLGPGRYHLYAVVPFFHGSSGVVGKARLQNVTDAATVQLGSSIQIPVNCTGYSIIDKVFTITTQKTFEVQMRVGAAATNNGWGQPVTMGDNEVYTTVEIEKIL